MRCFEDAELFVLDTVDFAVAKIDDASKNFCTEDVACVGQEHRDGRMAKTVQCGGFILEVRQLYIDVSISLDPVSLAASKRCIDNERRRSSRVLRDLRH